MNYKIMTTLLLTSILTIACNNGGSNSFSSDNATKSNYIQPSVAGKEIITVLQSKKFDSAKSLWHVSSLSESSTIDILQVSAKKNEPSEKSYLDKYKQYILSANKSIDIASLDSAPDNKTINVIADGISSLSYEKPNSPIEVRLMLGNAPVYNYWNLDNANQVLSRLTKNINPNSKIKISVGMYRTHPHSWNHAKILVVDGKDLISGGVNFISSDYTDKDNPVNDLSIAISNNTGSAKAASKFLDNEWAYLCDYKDSWIYNTTGLALQYSSWINNRVVKNNCTKHLEQDTNLIANEINDTILTGDYVISVGRLAGLDNWNSDASDIALIELLNQAHSNINISQQSLKLDYISTLYTFPQQVVDTLCKKMANGISVNVLMSGINGHPGLETPSVPFYSSNYTPETMANYMANQCGKDYSTPANNSLLKIKVKTNKVTPNLSLDKVPNHAKMVMIDAKDGRELVYIGSHNLYDGSHAEYGIIIDSQNFAQKFKKEYWIPNWN